LFGTAQHSYRIADVKRQTVGWVHLGAMIMAQENDIQMVIVLYKADRFAG
jgi:hypothetical protein